MAVLRRLRLLTNVSAVVACLLTLLQGQAASAAEAGPPAAAIASSHILVTEAGRDILRSGGNAFDAAVAMTAVLAVIEPYSSGLGGGGIWLLYHAADDRAVMLDGLVTTPELVHRNLFEQAAPVDNDGEPLRGVLTAGIPGVPAAIVHLSQRYGRLPLRASLAAAQRYADRGLPVDPHLQFLLDQNRQHLSGQAAGLLAAAESGGVRTLRQPDLAATLHLLAVYGRDGFYRGETARRLVNYVNRQGGVWTYNDLATYEVKERTPLVFNYRDMQITAPALPSSGGIVLGQALGMLSQFGLEGMNRTAYRHHVIEALRRAYRDRWVYSSEPELARAERLLDKDYLAGLALTMEPDRATPSAVIADTPGIAQTGAETTHFSVIDSEGNRVAATLSLHSLFGSGHMAAGSGILLNNEIGNLVQDDSPGRPFVPGARLLTNMTPVFFQTPTRLAVLGTPGGDRIASILLEAALDFSAGRDLGVWLAEPRYHHPYLPDVVEYEPGGFPALERQRLLGMGHELIELPDSFGDVQAVVWDRASDQVYAYRDPRGLGSAMVIPARQFTRGRGR